jgi:hypothetical protein
MNIPKVVAIWSIDPLPDFLLDHTLTEENPASKLREVVSRWVQLVGSLWRWRNAASFAIRCISDGNQIRLWMMATSEDPSQISLLRDDLSVLIRSHGLGDGSSTIGIPDEYPLRPFPDAIIVEVRQHENRKLWKIPDRVSKNAITKQKFDWVPKSEWEQCRVTYPWWAPGGPFLLPMEKLISQPVPASITIYLQPTELTERESDWLSFMARTAQSAGDQQEQALDQAMGQRKVDPAANLTGRIFMANFRRLSDKPFLVSVQCAAAEGRLDSALSLAGTIESIVYEPPFDRPQQEDDRLPSAATVFLPGSALDQYDPESAKIQYSSICFPEMKAVDPLHRIPYLVDARGASTVFRLPVNVKGGVPGVSIKQRPPDFHPGPRIETIHPNSDEIILGRLHQGGFAKVNRDQFCKHALITGFTGSGKTVTVLNIVHQLHTGGIPILAIESAKQEYRGLLGVRAFIDCKSPLRVFTVGNESCAPIRINPFELLPGVRVEAHISRLQTCFEAALPPIGPLSSMIGEALVNIYEKKGWRLVDIAPDINEPMYLKFPTMTDFYLRMESLVEERGYEGDVKSNVSAAVLGRIKPLTIGSKGLIFRERNSHVPGELRKPSPIAELFERSVILELNDLNIEDKAMLVMFILTFLREYRDYRKSSGGELLHVTVVEEAHNVLENVQSSGNSEGGSADTRYKAVQAFSNMLSEIRALGEGLIIADQSPEKLAPDAMRNTNIQIAHQLRDSKDREAIARAMIMDKEQQDFLGKLVPGQAAFFATGLQKATFLRASKYYPTAEDLEYRKDESETLREKRLTSFPGFGYQHLSDSYIQQYMNPITAAYKTGPFDRACDKCGVRTTCDYRKPILKVLAETDLLQKYSASYLIESEGQAIEHGNPLEKVISHIVETATLACESPGFDVHWCAFVHLWHSDPVTWDAELPEFSRSKLRNELSSLNRV